MEKVTIQSRMTKEDYKTVVYFGAFGKNRAIKPLMWLAILIGVLQVIMVIRTGRVEYPLTFYSSLVLFALIGFSYLIVTMDINRYVNTNRVSVDAIRTITIDDDGITVLQPDLNTANIGFDRFSQAFEIKGYFLLYLSNLQAVVLAKRDIKPMDIEGLRNIITRQMGQKFVLRSMK